MQAGKLIAVLVNLESGRAEAGADGRGAVAGAAWESSTSPGRSTGPTSAGAAARWDLELTQALLSSPVRLEDLLRYATAIGHCETVAASPVSNCGRVVVRLCYLLLTASSGRLRS